MIGPTLDQFIYEYFRKVYLYHDGAPLEISKSLGRSIRWVYDFIRANPILKEELEKSRDQKARQKLLDQYQDQYF